MLGQNEFVCEEVERADDRILELLGQLVKAIYGDVRRGLQIYEKKYGAVSFYKNFHASKRIRMVVARRGDELLGFACFRIGNEIYIYDIVVDERERGRGIGRSMIDYVRQKYKRPIWVEATEKSKGFFEKLGFKIMEEYEEEVKWYLMRWENVDEG